LAARVSGTRMTVVPPLPGADRQRRPAWQRDAVAQHDGGVLVHVTGAAEDTPRVAAAIWALEETGAFDQLVIDASAGGSITTALAELAVATPVRRVGATDAALPDALRDELARTPCVAVVVHADGDVALAAALAAARQGVALVRVGPVLPGSTMRVLRRLADLLLVYAEDDAEALRGAVAPERVHVIGNPLIDAVRRFSREAVTRAAWRPQRVEPGRYVLAVLTGAPAAAFGEPLAELAAAVPMVVEASLEWERSGLLTSAEAAGARRARAPGFVERLSLERGAGAIVTDSARVQEEAAALGIRCHALGVARGRVRLDAGGTTVSMSRDPRALARVRPDANAPTPCAIPQWDGRAGARLAEVLVANFARVRLA
jgi:UDP-N-acetylglucosamine 2-epimerase